MNLIDMIRKKDKVKTNMKFNERKKTQGKDNQFHSHDWPRKLYLVKLSKYIFMLHRYNMSKIPEVGR